MSKPGPLTGETIGRYAFGDRVGKGASSHVYVAKDRHLRRRVAVKVFLKEFLNSPARFRRVEREARIHARLEHPHIVRVYDLIQHDGQLFLVLRFVKGMDLRDVLACRRGPLEVDELNGYLRQIFEGVGYAHSRGVVHLDLKPHNILVTSAGEALIMDFGVACMVQQQKASPDKLVAGSPAYMAPEQAQGRYTDARTDIYSMAMTIYELLAARHPFEDAKTLKEVLNWQVRRVPRPIAEVTPGIPRHLSDALSRALAKKPRERFRSCKEFAEALQIFGTPGFNQIPDSSDQRWDPRGNIALPARVITGSGMAFVDAETLNLSASGVALRMKQPPSRGAKVQLRLELPDDPGEPLTVRSEVMWVRRDEDCPEYFVGLRFLDIDTDGQARVGAVVRDVLVMAEDSPTTG